MRGWPKDGRARGGVRWGRLGTALLLAPLLTSCSLLDAGPFSIGSILDGGVVQLPRATEECGNGLDDDGDGEIEEGCYCASGETQACFSGPFASRQQGSRHCFRRDAKERTIKKSRVAAAFLEKLDRRKRVRFYSQWP